MNIGGLSCEEPDISQGPYNTWIFFNSLLPLDGNWHAVKLNICLCNDNESFP